MSFRGALVAALGAWLAFSSAASAAAPAPLCDAEGIEPRVVSTVAADIPSTLWDDQISWGANLRFRLDPSGAPTDITAYIVKAGANEEVLRRITVATFAGYRFCIPFRAAPDRDWIATILFSYAKVRDAYLQSYYPASFGFDKDTPETGTATVRASIDAEGRAQDVTIAASSGAAVFDHRALDAVRGYRYALRPGTTAVLPWSVEQSFKFNVQ